MLIGFAYWVFAFPVDVVKTRQQAQELNASKKGLIRTFIKIWKNEGPRTLYKGISPALVESIPSSAIIFITYELAMDLLDTIL